jgi:formylmethanofuran dehydrogenase subunit E
MEKVIKNRQGSREEEAAFKEKGREAAFSILSLPFEELLITEKVHPVLPDYAPVTESVVCSGCGEEIMAAKTVADGKNRGRCLLCGSAIYYQVEGQGIIVKRSHG